MAMNGVGGYANEPTNENASHVFPQSIGLQNMEIGYQPNNSSTNRSMNGEFFANENYSSLIDPTTAMSEVNPNDQISLRQMQDPLSVATSSDAAAYYSSLNENANAYTSFYYNKTANSSTTTTVSYFPQQAINPYSSSLSQNEASVDTTAAPSMNSLYTSSAEI
jgi:hypothetical protein